VRPDQSQRGQRYLAAGACLLLLFLAFPAAAERAWVKDELRLNIRTGPGLKYRIIGSLETGDRVDIVSRGENWTEVRPDELAPGWIPVGYLQSAPPARIALAQLKVETADLRGRLESLATAEAELRAANEEIGGRDGMQQSEIARLTRENIELRAEARWPEWITGGGIVLVGMLLGAIVARTSGRRRPQRIRL
jgi:SH3 domain protein